MRSPHTTRLRMLTPCDSVAAFNFATAITKLFAPSWRRAGCYWSWHAHFCRHTSADRRRLADVRMSSWCSRAPEPRRLRVHISIRASESIDSEPGWLTVRKQTWIVDNDW